jgi:hypothetical protein
MRRFNVRIGALLCMASMLWACGDNMFETLGDDTSAAACQYETTQALDSKQYGAVLNSPCATSLDRGAAYLGLADFNVYDVIDRMIDANAQNNDAAQISTYLDALIANVSNAKYTNLYAAQAAYQSVLVTDPAYADAGFYLDVVINPLIALANVKSVIDTDGLGDISNCDINGNSIPDEADATACVLLDLSGAGCSAGVGATGGAAIATLTNATVGTFTGYTGYTVTLNGVGTASCPAVFRNLTHTGVLVTTSSDMCSADAGATYQWNCPFETSPGTPVDIVTTLSSVLATAEASLGTLNIGINNSTILDAIAELRADACGPDGVCDSNDLAAYLQTLAIN